MWISVVTEFGNKTLFMLWTVSFTTIPWISSVYVYQISSNGMEINKKWRSKFEVIVVRVIDALM